MRDGDQEMENEGKDAYELGYANGKTQQPRPELLFNKPLDNQFYNRSWYYGYKESTS